MFLNGETKGHFLLGAHLDYHGLDYKVSENFSVGPFQLSGGPLGTDGKPGFKIFDLTVKPKGNGKPAGFIGTITSSEYIRNLHFVRPKILTPKGAENIAGRAAGILASVANKVQEVSQIYLEDLTIDWLGHGDRTPDKQCVGGLFGYLDSKE